ncbi:MAG TPA: acyl-CoA dehydrogenase family protein [Methylomirabilota bacterium]|nr:acyl-CoA dehydrogenase family protein [Methylomirabilota bacterium]
MPTMETRPFDCLALTRELGPRFAARAAGHDADDTFVAENYADLRAHRAFSAGVPAELGGGGATYRELCEMLRLLARSCGSTALALSMHTHILASTVWRWRHQSAPVEPFLRRVAAEELVLVSTGGSDFLAGSGVAKKVEGGYLVTARKIFGSGSPGGDLLMTMAIYEDPKDGPTVLHFPVPMDATGVKVCDNWRTLGMRGTGSNDVLLENVFVPDAAVGVRRPPGRWVPVFYVIFSVAFPLVYSVYLGVAESARDLAVREAGRRRGDATTQLLLGELDTELTAARLAVKAMIDAADTGHIDVDTTNTVAMCRTLAGKAVLRTCDKAMEVASGAGFYRAAGLERLFRDAQAARFHPLQEKPQALFTGRVALGLDVNG